MANIEMLDKVLGHIKANPGSWKQSEWRCGTSYCFAGPAAILSGWKPTGPEKELNWRLRGFETEEIMEEYYKSRIAREEELASRFPGDKWYTENLKFIQEEYAEQHKEGDNTSDVVTLTGEERRTISSVAREVLDIDGDTAEVLFYGENSITDLENMVQEIKDNGYLERDDWDI